MSHYQHHVSGFFVKREEADIARAKLVARGLPEANMSIYENNATAPFPPPNANSSTALKGLLVDGAVNNPKKDGKVADLVGDAILSGQVVLVIKTQSPDETKTAIGLIQEAVGSFKDISTV